MFIAIEVKYNLTRTFEGNDAPLRALGYLSEKYSFGIDAMRDEPEDVVLSCLRAECKKRNLKLVMIDY